MPAFLLLSSMKFVWSRPVWIISLVLLLAVAVGAVPSASAASISFDQSVQFATPTSPSDVAIGDIDGDGKLDLLVVSRNPTATVFRNISTPGSIVPESFATVSVSTGAIGSVRAKLGDLDGDGKPDLVTGHAFSTTRSVRLALNASAPGIVSFAPSQEVSSGHGPAGIAIGDVDGDGRPDLAVAFSDVSLVSVFRNTGTSTGAVSFAQRVDFIASSGLTSVTMGDLNGDGQPDLVIATAAGLSVFRNTSSGVGDVAFAPRSDYVAVPSRQVAIADLDGDGMPDLAASGDVVVTVLRNTGTNGSAIEFAPSQTFAKAPSSLIPGGIASADLDGDGKLDLAATGGIGSTAAVSLLRNASSAGGITFEPFVNFATTSEFANGIPQNLVAGDLDGDGKTDLAVQAFSTRAIMWVLRNSMPIAASVTPDSASKVYGSADPLLTGTLSGFLPGDGVTATYSRTAGETVGTYAIHVELHPESVLGNYEITTSLADFTITPRGASVTPDALSKVYGSADPVLTGTLSGFLPGDGVTATYARTAGEAVGNYAISATLAPSSQLGNYSITSNTAFFTIVPKPGSNLHGASLNDANLDGMNLSGANLAKAALNGASLVNTDLSGANFNHGGANYANFTGANLSGTNLSHVTLTGSNLSGAKLTGANLSKANLSGVDLSGADLTGANLSGANLRNANLTGAILTEANLNNANLSGVIGNP